MKPTVRSFALILALFSVTFALSCQKKQPPAAGTKPVIAVSILPQQYFAGRIGGDRVSVLVLVGPGQNPHSYDPTPRQMADLSTAAVWIKSGTDFELALEPKIRSQFPSLAIVDGTEGVHFRTLLEGEHDEHDGEDHAAGSDATGSAAAGSAAADAHSLNIDRHSWLGEEPALILAGHIRDALSAADPAGKEVYEANYISLSGEIRSTYTELRTGLAPLAGRTVIVFHPAFGYFLDEFGIRQKAVEIGGKEPTARELASLIAEARDAGASAVFVQAQFPVAAADKVATAVGAAVVPLDPLAPDWLANIRSMGDALMAALREDR